jgi:tetratricopeptide (TPR) repeat protein
MREGRDWLTALLAVKDAVSPAIRAKALDGASYLASSSGEYGLAIALSQKSLATERDANDREGVAWALTYLAAAHYRRGDVATARAIGEQGLAIFRGLDRPEGILFAVGYVGLATQDQGDDAAAEPLLTEAVALGRRLGDRDNLSRALLGLGFLALYNRGDAATARQRFTESLDVSAELGHPYPLIYSLEGLASVAAAEVRPARALRLAGAAAALREARHAAPAPQLLSKHQHAVETARQASPKARQRALWSEGRAMSLAAIVAYAQSDEGDG